MTEKQLLFPLPENKLAITDAIETSCFHHSRFSQWSKIILSVATLPKKEDRIQ
jgi:hypothetical protein